VLVDLGGWTFGLVVGGFFLYVNDVKVYNGHWQVGLRVGYALDLHMEFYMWFLKAHPGIIIVKKMFDV
jgi:hypothetical protein